MNRFLKKICTGILCGVLGVVSIGAQETFAADAKEMRAVWISTVYSADYPSTTNNAEAQKNEFIQKLEQAQALGLLRMVGGLVSGGLHWVQPLSDGVEIGALALGPDDINDVEPDVSGHHLRIWCNEAGRWCVQGLGSSNGTVLISGEDGSGGAGTRGRFRMCRTGRGARRRRVGTGRIDPVHADRRHAGKLGITPYPSCSWGSSGARKPLSASARPMASRASLLGADTR